MPLSPGEPSLRKRSIESALQDQPPAKTVVRCALTRSEGTVEAVGVSSSAPVVGGGAVAEERSPPVCEGELCGVSSPSWGWDGIGHACSPSAPPPPSMCVCCLLPSQVVAWSGRFRPVSSSASVVLSGGAVAAERSPLVCEGELCGVSSPAVVHHCCSPSQLPVVCMHVSLNTHMYSTD